MKVLYDMLLKNQRLENFKEEKFNRGAATVLIMTVFASVVSVIVAALAWYLGFNNVGMIGFAQLFFGLLLAVIVIAKRNKL